MEVKTMKSIRYITAILAVLALTLSLGAPVLASFTDAPAKSIELSRKRGGDDPWDPGDESEGLKAPVGGVYWEFLLARSGRGDDPWDPGDESGTGMGVRRA